MLSITSPFVQNIEECKTAMKKLRKKIYKYTCAHKHTKRPKDSTSEILGLLKPRDLPNFLLDPIKKRRNFDINNLKTVMALPGATLEQITTRTNNQQHEIQNLLKQHKQRKQVQKKAPTPKFDRKWTASTYNADKEQQNSIYVQQQQFSYSERDIEHFMNPQISQFKIMGDIEDDNIDFFRNYEMNYIGHNLFEDDQN